KPVNMSRAIEAGAASTPETQVIRLNNEAAVYIAEKNYPAAEAKLQQALSVEPGDELIMRNLSVVYFNEGSAAGQSGDMPKAEQLYKRAIDFCKKSNNPTLLKQILT